MSNRGATMILTVAITGTCAGLAGFKLGRASTRPQSSAPTASGRSPTVSVQPAPITDALHRYRNVMSPERLALVSAVERDIGKDMLAQFEVRPAEVGYGHVRLRRDGFRMIEAFVYEDGPYAGRITYEIEGMAERGDSRWMSSKFEEALAWAEIGGVAD